MYALTFRTTTFLLALVLLPIMQSSFAAPPDCIAFGNPEHTDGNSKYEIREPGHYCLTEDMHARVEMADHWAERDLIVIRASDVVLDLQGHTLGRGRLLKNPGGHGIKIADVKFTNIHIKNGILQDFNFGVYRYDFPTTDEIPTYDAQTKTYRFPINNIVLENITFKDNKKNFQIRIPRG
jgi:hypothetical protein